MNVISAAAAATEAASISTIIWLAWSKWQANGHIKLTSHQQNNKTS